MASLRELLKEEQDPFRLDVYLLEKGYSQRICKSDARNRIRRGNSTKKLKEQSNSGLESRKEANPKNSKLLKSLLAKLVSGKNSNTSNCVRRTSDDGKFDASSNLSRMGRKTQVTEIDNLSSGCSTSAMVFSSSLDRSRNTPSSSACSYRPLKLCTSKDQQTSADVNLQWGCMEDPKQFSPLSVLELASDEGSPRHHQKLFSPRSDKEERFPTSSFNLPKEVLEDSILSVSLLDLLMHSMKEKHGLDNLVSDSSSQCMKTKRILQQTKQLLFDCVREVIESHGSKLRWHHQEYLGPELLGMIICDQILSWGNQDGDVTNIIQLLESDFKDPKQKWILFQPHIKDIGSELEDGIFESIIDDIVEDMFEILS